MGSLSSIEQKPLQGVRFEAPGRTDTDSGLVGPSQSRPCSASSWLLKGLPDQERPRAQRIPRYAVFGALRGR